MLPTSGTLIIGSLTIGSLKLHLHENGESLVATYLLVVCFSFMNHKYLIYLGQNTIRSALHFVNRHKW